MADFDEAAAGHVGRANSFGTEVLVHISCKQETRSEYHENERIVQKREHAVAIEQAENDNTVYSASFALQVVQLVSGRLFDEFFVDKAGLVELLFEQHNLPAHFVECSLFGNGGGSHRVVHENFFIGG